jgi:hypothetical protein
MIVKAVIGLQACRVNERRGLRAARSEGPWMGPPYCWCVSCQKPGRANSAPIAPSGACTVPCNDNTKPAGATKTFACSVGFGRRHQVGLPNDILEERRPWGLGDSILAAPAGSRGEWAEGHMQRGVCIC